MALLAASTVWQTIWAICLAVFILLAMITIHEFGHYIAGKIFKFKINEFEIGFGPKLFKKRKKNGELFSIRAIPLGGFCAFEGEDKEDNNPNAFNNKKPWQRIIVLFAGAFMNYIFAVLLLVVAFCSFGQTKLYIGEVVTPDNAIVQEYSLQKGDVLLKCGNKTLFMVQDLMDAIENKRAGDKVTFTLSRNVEGNRQVLQQEVVLQKDTNFKNVADVNLLWQSLGIAQTAESGYAVYSTSYKGYNFFQNIGNGFLYSFQLAGSVFKVLGQLLTGHLSLTAVGGPITTIKLTSQIAARGLQQFLEIAAYIGVNLAVFNLLPIPALDGSRILFTAIEWVRKKPLNRKVEAILHTIGLILLLGFAVLVDILQLF